MNTGTALILYCAFVSAILFAAYWVCANDDDDWGGWA